MKFGNMLPVAAATLLGLSLPAVAQTVAAGGLTVGAVVYGPEGSEVGKIEKIDGEIVVINTGTHSAALGSDSFAKGPNGPVIGYTKAKLDEVVEAANQQGKAKLDAALTAGGALRSADGKPLGAVQTLNPDGTVVVKDGTKSFSLDRNLFALDNQGLTLRITAQQLAEAMAKSGSSSGGK